MLSISAIIVSYNSSEDIAGCLDALRAANDPQLEVIVVDNASADGSADLVAQRFPSACLVRSGGNLGFGGGANLGFAHAHGDILLVLNPDVQMQTGALDRLRAAFADSSVGVAGCKLLFMDGQTLQHAGGVVEYPLATTRHRGYGEKDEGQYDEPADVPFVTGAALALRRNVLRDTGGFDAGFYPVYYEDTDLCYRARAAGWRVVYWPSAVALHRTSATLDQSSQAYFEFLHANRLRFILKHYTIQQIMNDVLPAEAARLRGEMPAADRLASRRACHALGDVHMPDYSELDHALDDLDKRRRLHERPFTSRAPLVGGLVARLRGAFNSIATRWYVLPIMEQQSAFNAGVVQTLRALARQADAQESVGAASQGILTKRLQALEERLERIEKHAPERSSGG